MAAAPSQTDSLKGSMPLAAPASLAALLPARWERPKERRSPTPPCSMLSVASFASVVLVRFAGRSSRKLPRRFQDRLARKYFVCRSAPLPADDSLKIDEEEPALRSRHIPIRV